MGENALVDRLLNLALIGGEPILYLLILLSLLSLAVVVERYVYYLRNRVDIAELSAMVVNHLNEGKQAQAASELGTIRAAEAAVIREGIVNFDKGANVAEELMESMKLKQQQLLDRWLIILGTIGSNAPFIGLLGTVLGIIKAFNDLAFNTEGGPSVVMAGIAEALVATAVGLLVAIPAVIFFNYFKNKQKSILNNIAQLENTLLAFMSAENQEKKETGEKSGGKGKGE